MPFQLIGRAYSMSRSHPGLRVCTDSEDEESSSESCGEDQRSLDGNNRLEEEFEVVISSIKKAMGHVPMLVAEFRARGINLS